MAPRVLKIGSVEVSPPLILAPMSGVTNRTMRALYKPFGLGLTVTEFVSSNALEFGSKRTMEMIDQHGVEKPVSTQLWGDDPATHGAGRQARARVRCRHRRHQFRLPRAESDQDQRRIGLPARSGPLRSDYAAVVAAVDCPVTMKMRLGWSEDALVYLEVAKRAQTSRHRRRSRCTRAPPNSSTRARPTGSTSRA